ncbi:hypothetical protein ACJX0J_031451 [Zea mays]
MELSTGWIAGHCDEVPILLYEGWQKRQHIALAKKDSVVYNEKQREREYRSKILDACMIEWIEVGMWNILSFLLNTGIGKKFTHILFFYLPDLQKNLELSNINTKH